jgi:hypothetical protein
MSYRTLRLACASTLACAAALVAPQASADPAHDDCAKLTQVMTRDETKLQGDAQGLTGHIHTLIHAARLVSEDATTESTDLANAHIASPQISRDVTDYAGALRDLSASMHTLITALEPIAGTTSLHNGIHQRIQNVLTDVAHNCPEHPAANGQAPQQSPDCAALLTKIRDFPQSEEGGPTAMADRIGAYSTSVGALNIHDPALKRDATEWASITHDISIGLRGVATFQGSFQSIQQRADTAASHLKAFCQQHQ